MHSQQKRKEMSVELLWGTRRSNLTSHLNKSWVPLQALRSKRFYIKRRYFHYPQKVTPEQPRAYAVNWTPGGRADLSCSSELLSLVTGENLCGTRPHLNFSRASKFNGNSIMRTWMTHDEVIDSPTFWARRAKPYVTVGPRGIDQRRTSSSGELKKERLVAS